VSDPAYSFWCSKCKTTHAGECTPAAVGSQWRVEYRYAPDGPWVRHMMTMIVDRVEPDKLIMFYDGKEHVSDFKNWEQAKTDDGVFEPSHKLWMRFIEVKR